MNGDTQEVNAAMMAVLGWYRDMVRAEKDLLSGAIALEKQSQALREAAAEYTDATAVSPDQLTETRVVVLIRKITAQEAAVKRKADLIEKSEALTTARELFKNAVRESGLSGEVVDAFIKKYVRAFPDKSVASQTTDNIPVHVGRETYAAKAQLDELSNEYRNLTGKEWNAVAYQTSLSRTTTPGRV